MLRSRNISSIVAKRHNISLEKNYPPFRANTT
jgi:hypothetical protein